GGLAGGAEVAFSARRIHYDEVTLLGSFHYTPDDVVEAQRLLASGEMKLGGLITGVRPLSELLQAFEELERGEGVKFARRAGARPACPSALHRKVCWRCRRRCAPRCCAAPTIWCSNRWACPGPAPANCWCGFGCAESAAAPSWTGTWRRR